MNVLRRDAKVTYQTCRFSCISKKEGSCAARISFLIGVPNDRVDERLQCRRSGTCIVVSHGSRFDFRACLGALGNGRRWRSWWRRHWRARSRPFREIELTEKHLRKSATSALAGLGRRVSRLLGLDMCLFILRHLLLLAIAVLIGVMCFNIAP